MNDVCEDYPGLAELARCGADDAIRALAELTNLRRVVAAFIKKADD